MLPDGVEHYVSEVARVLKPGGRCLISMFLLNEESLAWLAAGRGRARFDHDFGDYRVWLVEKPEAVVAYTVEYVRDVFRRHGFTPRQPDYGRWAGPNRSLTNTDGQDVVVAELDGAVASR
jgi:SAM-dependent methyltransferase